MLMRMLIDPPADPYQEMAVHSVPPPQPDVDRALTVLEKNASKIQPIGVIFFSLYYVLHITLLL